MIAGFQNMDVQIFKWCNQRRFLDEEIDFIVRILTQRTGQLLGLRQCYCDQTQLIVQSGMRHFPQPVMLFQKCGFCQNDHFRKIRSGTIQKLKEEIPECISAGILTADGNMMKGLKRTDHRQIDCFYFISQLLKFLWNRIVRFPANRFLQGQSEWHTAFAKADCSKLR